MTRKTDKPETVNDEALDVAGGWGMQNIKDTVVVEQFGNSGALPNVDLSNVSLTSLTDKDSAKVGTVAPPGTPWAKGFKLF